MPSFPNDPQNWCSYEFLKKHLWLSLFIDKVAGCKISEASEENTSAGLSFIIKLRAEKSCKIHKKKHVLNLVY